jgi:hypothetical protein
LWYWVSVERFVTGAQGFEFATNDDRWKFENVRADALQRRRRR